MSLLARDSACTKLSAHSWEWSTDPAIPVRNVDGLGCAGWGFLDWPSQRHEMPVGH